MIVLLEEPPTIVKLYKFIFWALSEMMIYFNCFNCLRLINKCNDSNCNLMWTVSLLNSDLNSILFYWFDLKDYCRSWFFLQLLFFMKMQTKRRLEELIIMIEGGFKRWFLAELDCIVEIKTLICMIVCRKALCKCDIWSSYCYFRDIIYLCLNWRFRKR